MKGIFRKEREQLTAEQIKLSQAHAELTQKLSDIRTNFDFATRPEDIDALIYEENATLSRLASLYAQAKADGISLQPFDIKK